MNEPQMTVTEFRIVAANWLMEFKAHWAERRVTVPDLFPEKMSMSDWGEQFSAWAEATHPELISL